MHVSVPVLAAAIALIVVLSFLLVWLLVRFISRSRVGSDTDTRAAIAAVESRLEALSVMSEQLQDLSRVFSVPRIRGEVGETMLAELLRNYLPPDAFRLQHSFPDGSRVDALVVLADTLIPVDSKFPLEAVRRFLSDNPTATAIPSGIRKTFIEHAKAIKTRYIQPEAGTTPYALMYVPSEGLYHRLFVSDPGDTMQEMLSLRVIPVSPGTLFLYLLTIAHAMRGVAFQSHVSELADLVASVRRMLEETEQAHSILRTHLKNAVKASTETERKLGRLSESVDRLEGR